MLALTRGVFRQNDEPKPTDALKKIDKWFEISGQADKSVMQALQGGQNVTVQVKGKIGAGVVKLVKRIQDVFGTSAAKGLGGAKFELMNYLFDRSKWPDGVVPSGFFRTDGDKFSCTALSIKDPLAWLFGQVKDLEDPSASFSSPFHSLPAH